MESFDIEFNHTDAEIARYADRCGCAKCERYRATPPALGAPGHIPGCICGDQSVDFTRDPRCTPSPASQLRSQIIAETAARTGTTPAAVVADARAWQQRADAPTATGTVQRGSFCSCPLGTRPNVARGTACTACGLIRRERTFERTPVAAQPSTESQATARALGVSTSPNTAPGGNAEILAPREQVIRDIESKLSGGLGATNRDLRKWDTLLRSVTVSASANPDGHVRHTEVVAGASTNASGIFLGFNGLGSLTRAELATIIADAGMPADWLPAAKSAHAQAGRIVGALHRHGYIVRAARVPVKTGKPQSSAERGWVARWNVGQAILGSNVGGSYGTTLLVATLTVGGRLVLEGREDLALTVRTEFDAACSAEVYAAADISSWLCSQLVGRFRAAAVGGNWYVRRKYADDAEKLCTALARVWGRNWLLPAIPMSTTEQLCAGLVKNFAAEVDAVLNTYRDELADAKKHGDSEIGSRRATTLLGEVRTLAERAVGFASMFGDSHMAILREKLCVAADEIANSVDGISQRFALIFDELRRDAGGES